MKKISDNRQHVEGYKALLRQSVPPAAQRRGRLEFAGADIGR
jgi:hypothetical protein